ncbi:LOW QUALITY PROTEIN: uncharacterized protein LOC123520192 [Portunus trituberculatus]|uniref:LOW QUALITY PROTEIN: uncharacterized protein LOC123520192 n=1 Tax=Portunus trituberculatus TaxID=210409 RepID=UPI001E1CD8C7|nr:LOW QUALITY PROTEIN: uncharacterized protein LOC123520192 [Portunus trituberculatus]
MAHCAEDIRNNNVLVEREVIAPAAAPAISTGEVSTSLGAPVVNLPGPTVLAQLMARNLDNLADDTAPNSLGSITVNDEYLEDPLPDLTLENLRLPEEYGDPSLGYEFVNTTDWCNSGLDNSHALLQQLQGLGVRVNEDYLTLDLELSASRSASVSSVSEDECSISDEQDVQNTILGAAQDKTRRAHSSGSQKDAAGTELFSRLSENQENEVFLEDHEVAEAEILPSGGVKVTYENYRKEYRPKISPHHNYIKFLETVSSGASTEEPLSIGHEGEGAAVPSPHLTLEDRYRRILQALQRGARLSDVKMRSLSAKYARKLRRLLAEEVTYDAVTPDSGVHENFNALSPDEQEKLREEWKAELAKTEEEIQTLRQVLGAKVKTAQDLKRRLGITVWREFTEDFNNSMKTVRESQPVQKANEVITEIQEAVSSAPLYRRMSGAFSELGESISQQPVYQKTAGAMSAVGEKTSSLFGGIGAKFGQLKETPTFKSFEERVGGVYSAARTRMGGSGSNSTQDFEEALKEAEGEKAALEAANGGTLQTSTTPGTDVTQPAAS